MEPNDSQLGCAPSAELLAEFERQLTEELLHRLSAFAARRLRGYGGGNCADMERARDLVMSAATDTVLGRVRWNPERRDLKKHLQNVIGRRMWLEWKWARRFPHESIDASSDDEHSAILNDMERALAERLPDPDATANAAEALDELERRALNDPELAAYIEARADGLDGVDLLQATGLSPQRIRSVRRRLDEVGKQLPVCVRPKRKRGQ
jgi:hypothetical protein